MTKILALNSIRGKSGKDTLIGLLESEGRSVLRVAFADILKEECSQILAGGPGGYAKKLQNNMNRSIKDAPDGLLSAMHIAPSSYRYWLSKDMTPAELYESRSLRWHLQQYGTEYKRELLKDPDVWLNAGLKEIEVGLETKPDFIVVTDLRLPNEYLGVKLLDNKSTNWVNRKHPTKTVRIVRDWFIPGVDDQPYHISDTALMAHPFDGLVVNRLGEPWAMLDQLKDQGVID